MPAFFVHIAVMCRFLRVYALITGDLRYENSYHQNQMDLCHRPAGLVHSLRDHLKPAAAGQLYAAVHIHVAGNIYLLYPGKYDLQKGRKTGAEVIQNDGTGYRISLIAALIFCIIAMIAIIFYKEDKVMAVINRAHAEANTAGKE